MKFLYLIHLGNARPHESTRVRAASRHEGKKRGSSDFGPYASRDIFYGRAAVKAAASGVLFLRFTEAAIVGGTPRQGQRAANKNGASSLTVRCVHASKSAEGERLRETHERSGRAQNGAHDEMHQHTPLPSPPVFYQPSEWK